MENLKSLKRSKTLTDCPKAKNKTYSQSDVEAIVNNYLDDSDNEEYQVEFKALQDYRKECKAKAKEILKAQLGELKQ